LGFRQGDGNGKHFAKEFHCNTLICKFFLIRVFFELEFNYYILLLSLLKKYEKEKVISSNRVTRKFGFIFHKLSMLLEQENDYSGTDRDLGNL